MISSSLHKNIFILIAITTSCQIECPSLAYYFHQRLLFQQIQYYTREQIQLTHYKINNKGLHPQMWNLISSNRILDMRAKQASHNRHLQALRKMKPTMHIKTPQQYQHVQEKAKEKQKNKQRNLQIQSHNTMLVNRMITMPSYIQAIGDVYFKSSLQDGLFKRRERAIDHENQKIVRRLQSANSKYSQRVMSKSVKSYYRAKTIMASSKMDQFYDFQSLGQKKSLQVININAVEKGARPFSAKK